ncbi:MAG: DUF3995 domain-containing protein [Spirochaetia bacterium]|nr:DUF3995 domain-containing protein [Spirochaetia bacterium]
MILKIYLAIVFTFIAGFHIYWAFGGKKGISAAIPESEQRPLFKPEFGGTIFIALIFLIGIILVILDIFEIEYISIQRYLYEFISIVFFIRVIGEFKYVGIFKEIRKTKFAKYDNLFFIPLCFSISMSSFIILI